MQLLQAALTAMKSNSAATSELVSDIQRSKKPSRAELKELARKYLVTPFVGFQFGRKFYNIHEGWCKYECWRRVLKQCQTVSEDAGIALFEEKGTESTCVAEQRLPEDTHLRRTPRNIQELSEVLHNPKMRKYAPFGLDFETTTADMAGELKHRKFPGLLLEAAVVARWLALVELHPVGFAYNSTSKKQLPYTLAGLCSALKEVREERCCRARTMIISTSDDLAKFLIDSQPPPQSQWLHCIVHLCFTDEERHSAHGSDTRPSLQLAAAEIIAEKFFTFVKEHDLFLAVQNLDEYHIATLAFYHAQLTLRKRASRHISRSWQYAQPRKAYVPVDAVSCPEPPHFIALAEGHGVGATHPIISAPRPCQLCGKGFLSFATLKKHCDKEHGGYCQYRTRVFHEAKTRRYALPMRPMEKRRLIGNYHRRITQSVPSEGVFANRIEVERQIVACVVCARTRWIEQAFPCAMWVPYPENGDDENDDGPEQEAHSQSEEETDDEEKEECNISRHSLPKGILRDQQHYYFGPANKVNILLCV